MDSDKLLLKTTRYLCLSTYQLLLTSPTSSKKNDSTLKTPYLVIMIWH
ncbi:unnamed protein product [Acanthoscelides obtectus]|uniref:Uncharacterized protein n=1 Tax=Acanthoscelides obtectus TaxID=200917 RepID=A0A9P0KWU5_ACAOB|nr:unnamed protein product [Acanthoscelides obtectus]CAK1631910.1 hypothetical protein AOBTE_LOCUS7233 [Acanthoscelides obtectus]